MDTAPALLRNIGTKADPRFDFPQRLKCFGDELSGIAKHGPYYSVGDLDGDGKPDLLACTGQVSLLPPYRSGHAAAPDLCEQTRGCRQRVTANWLGLGAIMAILIPTSSRLKYNLRS